MKIAVVPYHPQWPEIFAKEAARIKLALGENCVEIHHVGSTAISGISAKPIIDMIPVVKDIVKVDATENAMIKLGYDAKGEAGMLFRRFFTKSDADISFNIHVYEADAGEVDRLLKFRDWMRSHPLDAQAYSDLKNELAIQFVNERLHYTMGKENFVASIDSKTGFAGCRIVKVLTDREWEAYHRIRKQEIFDLMGVEYDINHPGLTDKSRDNLVLYKGSAIVGVAQLEYLDANEVALRPYAIDAPYQQQGLGKIFLTAIEKWLNQQGRHIIRLHAYPKAVKFYEKLGYSPMPFPDKGRSFDFECVDMGKEI